MRNHVNNPADFSCELVEAGALLRYLQSLAEPEYQRFALGLLPGMPPKRLLGVRLPVLRRLARRIARDGWQTYLNTPIGDTFEEVMLRGMVIGYANIPFAARLLLVESFVPKIDNWSVCDSFCAGLKIAQENPEGVWRFLQRYFEDEREFFARFGIVMLLDYYVDAQHTGAVLAALNRVRAQGQYAKLATAWALAECCAAFPAQTLAALEEQAWDPFVRSKALQKMKESKKIPASVQQQIRLCQKE